MVEAARPRVRSGLEDTRPSRVYVCVCGHARVSEGAPVLRPLVVEVGRTGTGQHRIGAGKGGHSDRSTPKRTQAPLDVVAAEKACGTAAAEETGMAATEDIDGRGCSRSAVAAGGAIAGGAIASVVPAGDAPAETVTAESAGRAAAPEGAVWCVCVVITETMGRPSMHPKGVA